MILPFEVCNKQIPVLRSSWYTACKTKKKKKGRKICPKGSIEDSCSLMLCWDISQWYAHVSCKFEVGRKWVLFLCGKYEVFKTRLAEATENPPWPHSWLCSKPEAGPHELPEALPASTILWYYEAKGSAPVCSKNVRWQLYLKVVYRNADDLNHQNVLL